MSANYSTDKVDLGYLPTYVRMAYEACAEDDFEDAVATLAAWRILEVGVAIGGGLDMFAAEFPGAQVYGVDINPEAGRPEQRDRILTSAQDDPGLAMVLQSNGWAPFNLIVDDASHMAGPTAVTIANLWALVKPGGYYVIEDWNYFDGPGNAQNLWQKLIGGFLAYPATGDHRPHQPYSGILPNVDSVEIRNGMIIVRKGQ